MEKKLWPGWETVRRIGQGSFGSVYEIRRENISGHVEKAALKVITIPQDDGYVQALYGDGLDQASITRRFSEDLKNIVKEYDLMTEMKGHSHIVSCEDLRYIQHENQMGWDIYIKMELLTPLLQALPQEIPEEQVVRVGIDLCKALEFCQKKHVIHRDIKPQNIFISPDGSYKLGDFGIAKVAERTTSGTKTGTFRYMAPEVYNNQPYGSSVDIYSLGMVLYWMLNERRMPFLPLPPQSYTAIQEDQAQFRRMNGEALPPPLCGSEKLKRIVLKACDYHPENRYSSAEELLNTLRQLEQPEFGGTVEENKTMVMPPELKIPFSEPKTPEQAPKMPKPNILKKKKYSRAPLMGVIAAAVLVILGLSLYTAAKNGAKLKQSVQSGYEAMETEAHAAEPYTTEPHATEAYTVEPPAVETKPPIIETEPEQTKMDVSVGDIISLGSYPQTANGDERPIDWIVLEVRGDEALLISEYGLDSLQYHGIPKSVTWADCSLRHWLNSIFLKVAFTEEERGLILEKDVTADSNPLYKTYPGTNTTDSIFVLSLPEVERYMPSNDDRICTPTPYAIQQGAFADPVYHASWWIFRTPGDSEDKVASTNCDGTLDYDGGGVNSNRGIVRPVMWIRLE